MRPFLKKSPNLQFFLLGLTLIITVLAYSPVFFNAFVNWDDNVYITTNPLINGLNLTKIVHMFSGSFEGHYHPFTLISLAIDNFFFGLNPQAFHIHNLLLHFLNICLVFLFLKKLLHLSQTELLSSVHKPNTVIQQYNYLTFLPVFVAGIFAVHSINVEAIAWATARKDVLFSFWFLLSLVFYLNSLQQRKQFYYYLSILSFIFAALSKGQAFVLPFCLMTVDFLLKQKLFTRKNLVIKAPFLIISLITAIIAIYAQKETGYTSQETGTLSIAEILVYPSLSFILYIWKIFLPVNLSAYYPYPESPDGSLPAFLWVFVPISLAIVTLIIYSIRKNRMIAFGLLFFAINIFMFLKWVPVSNYIIADRYSYLAGIGIYIIAGYGLNELIIRKPGSKALIAILIVLLITSLSMNTYSRCRIWKDSLTLLNDILKKNPDVYTALNSRGDVYAAAGDTTLAMSDFNKAIQLRPQFGRAFANRATLLAKNGNCSRALADFNKALELNPMQASAYANRARCLNLSGDFNASLSDLKKSKELGFNHPMVYYETGIAYYNLRDFNQAILEFNKVEKLAPDYPSLHTYRGYANFNSNDMIAAIDDLNIALVKDPVNPVTIAIRGMAKVRSGDRTGGCEDLQKARQMGLIQAQKEIEKYCR